MCSSSPTGESWKPLPSSPRRLGIGSWTSWVLRRLRSVTTATTTWITSRARPLGWGWEVLHHRGSLQQVRGDWAGLGQEYGGHGGLERSPKRGHHWQQIKLQFQNQSTERPSWVVKRIGIEVGNRWTQEIFLNQTIGKFHVCVFFRFQPNSQKVKFVIML